MHGPIKLLKDKPTRIFIILTGFFIANFFLAEFIGVKIFALEDTFGFEKFSFSFFGKDGLSMDLTAGVLLWPFVFVLTDVINEYYGKRGVRMISYLSVALILYAFIMVYMCISLAPAAWWPATKVDAGVPDLNAAFKAIFGQGLGIIIGSIIAFLVGQLVDVTVFHKLKQYTGEKAIWLRATGSTMVSQFIDSFVVLFIAFYLLAGWDWRQVLAIGMVNYIYKFVVAILMTPAIYLAHYLIDRYFGKELAQKVKDEAAGFESAN